MGYILPHAKMESELRRLAHESGMKLHELARAAGIKSPSMLRFLRGGSLRLSTAERLLGLFGYEIRRKDQEQK